MALREKISKPLTMHDLLNQVGTLVESISGNMLGDKQHDMMENRLKRRMRQLSITDPSDYMRYIQKNKESESKELIALLTTHHTFFFREFIHFEHLLAELPRLVQEAKKRGSKKLRLWSAACSKGHEPYSMALFLSQHLPLIDSQMDYEIFASDIDQKSVEEAQNGVYHAEDVKQIPLKYLGNNFIRGKEEISDYYKVRKTIAEKIIFKPLNLLDSTSIRSLGKFDVIFCRNVLIYFKDPDIVKVINNFKDVLHVEGLLYTGVSESLIGRVSYAESVFSSCYRLYPQTVKPNDTSKNIVTSEQKIIKVLCVDDSPTVLKILKKIFSRDKGYEVVATAMNGQEAQLYLEKNNVDVMTLDIHMPIMDGITYLEKNSKKPNHPPVIMVTSVTRDDAELAQKALALGASDFVEKPSLENMENRSEEIRSKVKACLKSKPSDTSKTSSFDQGIVKQYASQSWVNKHLFVHCSYGDKENVAMILETQLKSCGNIIVCLMEDDPTVLVNATNYFKTKNLSVKIVSKVDPYFNGVDAQRSVHLFFKNYFKTSKARFTFNDVVGKCHCIIEEGSLFERPKVVSNYELVPLTTFSYSAIHFFRGLK